MKIERIWHIIVSFDFKIAWAPRSINSAADDLARQGLSLDLEVVNTFCNFGEGICSFSFAGLLLACFFLFVL